MEFPLSYSNSMPMVVPLARKILSALSHIRSFLRTSTSIAVLREMHVRLLARLAVNNLSEVIASSALGIYGRAEIRTREVGYGIPPGTAEIPLPFFDDRCDLRAYTIGDRSYDETMQVVYQMINHTTPGTGAHGFAPHYGEVHGQLVEEGDEQVIAVETCKQALAHFANLSDQERMEADPYTALYEQASIFIIALGEKLGFSSDVVMARLNARLFAPLDGVRFLLDSAALSSPDQIWRTAHTYDQWAEFSQLARRLVSCPTSETDAERILSTQKSIASLHGTRFGIPGLEARIRCHVTEETSSRPETVVAGEDQRNRTESDESESESDPDREGNDQSLIVKQSQWETSSLS